MCLHINLGKHNHNVFIQVFIIHKSLHFKYYFDCWNKSNSFYLYTSTQHVQKTILNVTLYIELTVCNKIRGILDVIKILEFIVLDVDNFDCIKSCKSLGRCVTFLL